MPIPGTRSPDDIDVHGGDPSDHDLDHAVQEILRSADLNSITKREIRRQLESHFGMDLTSRKTVINASIDRVLLDQNWFSYDFLLPYPILLSFFCQWDNFTNNSYYAPLFY